MPPSYRDSPEYRSLRAFLYAIALWFPLVIMADTAFDTGSWPSLLVILPVAVFGTWCVGTRMLALRGSAVTFLMLISILAVTNVIVALERFEAAGKWILWLGQVTIYVGLLGRLSWGEVLRLFKHFPWVLLISTVVGRVLAWRTIGVGSTTNQVVGLYGGGAFVTALFFLSGWRRIVVAAVAFGVVFTTASRGAMFGAVIAVLPMVLLLRRQALFPLVGLGVLGLFVASGAWEAALDRFSGYKASARRISAVEAVQMSAQQRADLAVIGWELLWERPYGYGLGNGYTKLVAAAGVGRGMTVHNGLLDAAITSGVQGAVVSLVLLAAVLWRLAASQSTPFEMKVALGCYAFYYFLRSLSEAYFVFNSGNSATALLLLFCVAFLVHPGARSMPGSIRATLLVRRTHPTRVASSRQIALSSP